MTIKPGLNNHVEMVHAPGEIDKAIKLLTLLGCEPIKSPYPYKGVLFVFAKTEQIWISEVSPQQWAFEQWLRAQIDEEGTDAVRTFMGRLAALPQAHGHFGIGLETLSEWEDLTDRLRTAIDTDPDLQGRVTMPIYHPTDHPDSVCSQSGGKIGKTLSQAFLRTDLISTGLLTMGQAIEIQHYRENDPTYTGDFASIQASIAESA